MPLLTFTPTDRLILQSYALMLDGLAAYLGNYYEFVLYSLEDMDRSVIKIINGQYTGRQIGAPISGLASSILDHFQEDGKHGFVCYTTDGKNGKNIEFTAIAIRGEQQQIIGLLCINGYQNAPQQEVLDNYFENPDALSCIHTNQTMGVGADPEALIAEATIQTKKKVNEDPTILPSLKNKQIVAELKKQGIFGLKNSVAQVADILGVSKNTIYMHLRSAEKYA